VQEIPRKNGEGVHTSHRGKSAFIFTEEFPPLLLRVHTQMENIDHSRTMKYCSKCAYWFHALAGCDCDVKDPGNRVEKEILSEAIMIANVEGKG